MESQTAAGQAGTEEVCLGFFSGEESEELRGTAVQIAVSCYQIGRASLAVTRVVTVENAG